MGTGTVTSELGTEICSCLAGGFGWWSPGGQLEVVEDAVIRRR